MVSIRDPRKKSGGSGASVSNDEFDVSPGAYASLVVDSGGNGASSASIFMIGFTGSDLKGAAGDNLGGALGSSVSVVVTVSRAESTIGLIKPLKLKAAVFDR